jgi:Ca2+-binding EF-hand superfamily protein
MGAGGGEAAAGGADDPQALITALDFDHNGSVSRNEFLNAHAARFAQFDVDGSGQMTLAEFRAALDGIARDRAPTSLQTFDYNGNGRLSQSEYLSYQTWIYNNVLDRNRDGAWTVEEYRSFLARAR